MTGIFRTSLMKKSVTISELRQMIRSVLLEADPNRVSRTPAALPPRPSGVSSVAKTGAAPSVQNGKNRVYNADGTSREELPFDSQGMYAPGQREIIQTHMPPTMHPPTIPAKASNAERAMSQDMKAKGATSTGDPKNNVDPNRIPREKSAGSTKAALVHKALTSRGAQADINALQQWIAGLDPSESLVKTAEDLANDYMFQTGM